VGHVESVVGAPGTIPMEVRVALDRSVVNVTQAAVETRLLRVPGDDILEREDGALALRGGWNDYRGNPSPPVL
jgi:hypothetical protein